MTPTLRARGIRVTVDGRTLVDDVDVDADRGAWAVVLGANGAGKSTLLRCLAGATRHAGTVTVDGVELRSLRARERARVVAVVPQRPVVPTGMAVRDYVLLGRTPHVPPLGVEGAHDHAVVGSLLERLELDGLAGREVATLSGGEQQRAVIARALAQEAPLLLLDEPTTALDIGHQQEVLALVDELRRERGLTVVSAMHDLTMAAHHGDRFVLLHHGRVHRSGAVGDVFRPDVLRACFAADVDVVDHRGVVVVVPRRRGP